MKIILTLSLAILFSSISYTIAQQGKPTTAKPATTAAPKVAAKPVQKPIPKTSTQKPKVVPKIKVDTTAAKPDHKPIKKEIGVTGMSTNFGACAIITLKNATLDFWPTHGENIDNPKKIKKQFVRVEIDVLSNCDEPYSYNYVSFQMKCADGTTVMNSIHLTPAAVPDQKTEIQELPKGQKLTTAIYFEVPDTETINTLTLIVNGHDANGLTTALDLKLGN